MRLRTNYGSILDDIKQWSQEAEQYKQPAANAMATILNPKSGIEWIKIQTAYGPDILITEPLAPGAGEPNPIVKLLKPKVLVKLRPLPDPVAIAPEGEPGPTQWPLVSGVAVFVGGISLALILRGLLR